MLVERLEYSCRASGRGRNRKYIVEVRLSGLPAPIYTEVLHPAWFADVRRGQTASFDALMRCLALLAMRAAAAWLK